MRYPPICTARCLIAPVTEEVPIGLIWVLYRASAGHGHDRSCRVGCTPSPVDARTVPPTRPALFTSRLRAPLIAVTWMPCPGAVAWAGPNCALPSWPRMDRISAARSCVPDACGAIVRTVPSRRLNQDRPLTELQYYGAGQHGGPVPAWVHSQPGGSFAARPAASLAPSAAWAGRGVCSKPGTSSRQSFDASLRPPGRPRVHP